MTCKPELSDSQFCLPTMPKLECAGLHCGFLRAWRAIYRPSGLNRFVNLVPATPTDNSQLWLWRIRQHRKKLEHISIWVAEIERCNRHPCKHYGFVGRLAPKSSRTTSAAFGRFQLDLMTERPWQGKRAISMQS